MKNLMALMLLAVSGNLLAADTCTSVLTDQDGNEVSAFAVKDSCTDANYSCLNTLSEKLANGDIQAGNCAESSFRGPRPGPGPRPPGGVGPGPGPRPPHYPAPGPGPTPRPPHYPTPGPAPRPPHYPVPGPGPRPPSYPYPVPPPPPIYYNCTVDMVDAYSNMLIRRYWETAPSKYSACDQALYRCESDRRYEYGATRCFISY